MLYEKVTEASNYIKSKTKIKPQFAIILGTGLGALAKAIKSESKIPYRKIPHFARSTVESHKGELILGKLKGKDVVAMEGRFHFYEGYSMEQVTFPVRVAKALGAKILIVSNVCGGLNPAYSIGDIMLISDHINLMGVNPLIGHNDERLGQRFPDMIEPYDQKLIKLAEDIAVKNGFEAHRGVYAALTGPCLETRAEYRFLRIIGADAVGMSTVPEVIVAVHAGLKTLGISVISDICLPDNLHPVDIKKIIAAGQSAEPKLTKIVKEVIRHSKV